jgi:ribosome-binding protein aMBF1 (putative translation factor)
MNESELLRTRELSASCEDTKRELAKAQDSLKEEHHLVEQMQLRIDYLDESRRWKVRELHQKLKDCEVFIQKYKQSQLEYEN